MNKKIAYAAAFSATLLSGSAFAADLASKKMVAPAPVASPWDFEVGAGLTTDYIFRGISQSNHKFSVAAHGELRYNFSDIWQGYAGVAGESIKLTPVDTNPSMELDTYGGVRGTFGNFSTDVGAWGYLYPGLGTVPTPNTVFTTQLHWFEVYGKVGYNFTDTFNVGANFFYTPSYIHTGADGEYLSGTFKWTIGDFALSGELGRQWLGTTDSQHSEFFTGSFNYKLPSYTTWNIGGSYTFKFATLDVRYYGTDLSRSKAVLITGPTNIIPTGGATDLRYRSNLADQRIVATLSFALTGKDLK